MMKRRNFSVKSGVQLCVDRQLTQARDLALLPPGVSSRQRRIGFISAHRLRYLESLRQHENQRCVDVVDTLAIAIERLVHGLSSSCCRLPLIAIQDVDGKSIRLPIEASLAR